MCDSSDEIFLFFQFYYLLALTQKCNSTFRKTVISFGIFHKKKRLKQTKKGYKDRIVFLHIKNTSPINKKNTWLKKSYLTSQTKRNTAPIFTFDHSVHSGESEGPPAWLLYVGLMIQTMKVFQCQWVSHYLHQLGPSSWDKKMTCMCCLVTSCFSSMSNIGGICQGVTPIFTCC